MVDVPKIPILANNNYDKIIGVGNLVNQKLTIILTVEALAEVDTWLESGELRAISLDFSKRTLPNV